MQVKLLRFLNNGEYTPLGSQELRQSNARIIAATNKDIEALVKDGTFRSDLYYRLKENRIELPPMYLRIEDIPLWVFYFISQFNKKNGGSKPIINLHQWVLKQAAYYEWSGNVREFRDCIARACEEANAMGSDVIKELDIPELSTEALMDNADTRKQSVIRKAVPIKSLPLPRMGDTVA